MFVAVLLAGLGAFAGPLYGQQNRTLVIRDGAVWIDGARIPAQALPESLDLEGVTAQLSFGGDAAPLVVIDGASFRIEPDGLVAVDEASAAADFRFEIGPGLPQAPVGFSSPGLGRISGYQAELGGREDPAGLAPGVPPGAQAAPMVGFGRSGRVLDRGDGRYLTQHARRPLDEAEAALRAASELPRRAARAYLHEVQQRDEALFNRLVAEHEMEMQTQILAMEIAQLPSGEERDAKTAALRSKLEEIFELKQENRRREIAQLNDELERLRRRLRERETLRDEIIDRRLQQLVEQR